MANQVIYTPGMNYDLKPQVSRSLFDLSYVHSFTGRYGRLMPVYLQDCVPNDTFDISVVLKATTVPFASPFYNNIRIFVDFYYVPYYLLWRKFDRFIFGGRDGRFTVAHPVLSDTNFITFQSGSIGDYLGFPVGVQIPKEDAPSAFPFMAYQRIYRDYYMNQDVQQDKNITQWFPDDDSKFQLGDGSQTTISPMGADVSEYGDPISLTEMRFHNWRDDYFTKSMFSPQRGGESGVPVTLGDLDVYVDGITEPARVYGWYGMTEKKNFSTISSTSDTELAVRLDLNDSEVGRNYRRGTVTTFTSSPAVGSEGVGFTNRKLVARSSSNTALGFTVNELRLATQLQIWLERNMRTKAQYNESLRIHFADAPLDERLTKPAYIGGYYTNLNVSDVVQTSNTNDSSYLGQRAGVSNAFDSGFVGKFHSHEFGLIMGICWIMPDAHYTQGIDREWSKKDRFDYYFPEFAQLSPQAILAKELYANQDTQSNNTVFAYQGRFDEMRHRRNRVTGLLRDVNSQDFFSWTAARVFSSHPTLTASFINSENTVRTDAFVTGDSMDYFIIQAGFNVRAVRPLPVQNVPQGLM